MTNWYTHLHAIVQHPAEPRILLLQTDDDWQLPTVRHPEKLWHSSVTIVTATFCKLLNANVWALRQIYFESDQDTKTIEAIFEMELLDPEWKPPPHARWVDKAELHELFIPSERLYPSVDAYLSAQEEGIVPKLRPPWARPGWLPIVNAWIEAELIRYGETLRELEQVKQWGISCVLRAKTDNEDFYFKAPNQQMPLFANEAAVTAKMAKFFPGRIATPLSIDLNRDWMLLPDFGEEIPSDFPLEEMTLLLRRYAELQKESIPLTSELLLAGCLDRRMEVLTTQIDPLLADPIAVANLTSEQLAELRTLASMLKKLCLQLSTFNIPPTLVHGDLHLGNVARMNGAIIFFDWTDASLAHPFFDLLSLNWEKDEHKREAMLTAYLEMWTEYESMERLREAWKLANILERLHQAVSYQHIVRNLEPDSRPELDFTHRILIELLKRVRVYLE